MAKAVTKTITINQKFPTILLNNISRVFSTNEAHILSICLPTTCVLSALGIRWRNPDNDCSILYLGSKVNMVQPLESRLSMGNILLCSHCVLFVTLENFIA